MTDHNRICPNCGKKLTLIPPDRELLPNRTGFSMNGVIYYFSFKPRFFSVVSSPKARYQHKLSDELHFEGAMRPNEIYPRHGYVPVQYAKKRINKGGLSLFDRHLIFYCENCKQKLTLNYNPMTWFNRIGLAVFLSALVLCTATGMSAMVLEVLPIDIMTYIIFGILISLAAAVILLSCGTAAAMICVKRFTSNFVPTDELDGLVFLSTDLTLANIDLRADYLHISNIFTTEIGGESFNIYLTEKGERSLGFHICGVDGEPERMMSLLREKMDGGEKAVLPLTFEGKAVGSAEVQDIYQP